MKTGVKVTVDWSAESARFSGDTFLFRDQIKQIGPARWLPVEKMWEVRPFRISINELRTRLPVAEIEEVGAPREELAGREVASSSGASQGVSVSELAFQIERAFEAAFPRSVLVYGIVSSLKLQGERVFLELSERDNLDSRLRAVIWRDSERILEKLHSAGFTLEPELDVMFEVLVKFNRRQGSASLQIIDVVPEYTVGKLAAKREQTNKRLQSEGIFSRNKALAFPFLPKRLGLLTSSGGTVIHDFLKPLEEARCGFELFWLPVQVQGEGAIRDLVRGIERLSKRSDLDAILIFRGGGSPSELAVFSEYEVARAVCLSPLPVLAAVGHQEDQSSTQDVAWRAFGVPKDLGHFLANTLLDYRARVRQSCAQILTLGTLEHRRMEERTHLFVLGIRRAMEEVLRLKQTVFERVHQLLPYLVEASARQGERSLRDLATPLAALGMGRVSALEHRLANLLGRAEERLLSRSALVEERLRVLARRVSELAIRAVGDAESGLARMEDRVQEASPETQLKRGFALIRGEDGSVFPSGGAVPAQTRVEIQFRDVVRKATME